MNEIDVILVDVSAKCHHVWKSHVPESNLGLEKCQTTSPEPSRNLVWEPSVPEPKNTTIVIERWAQGLCDNLQIEAFNIL